MPSYYLSEDLARFAEIARTNPKLFDLFLQWYSTTMEKGALDEKTKKLIALAGARAVVEPAEDGGINLIALRAPERVLLSSIRPRQSDVLERCRAYFDTLVVLSSVADTDQYVPERYEWISEELPVGQVAPSQPTARPPPSR